LTNFKLEHMFFYSVQSHSSFMHTFMLTVSFEDARSPDHKRRKLSDKENTTVSPRPRKRAAKVSVANLPLEYQLARLIRNIENPHYTWGTDMPACEWNRVECNEQGEPEAIHWHQMDQSACPNLWDYGLIGSLDLTDIPKMVKHFSVQHNQLRGEIRLDGLPDKLENLDLSQNVFEGSLDLTSLPPSLYSFCSYKNKFTGNVCLTRLPPPMEQLLLGDNRLTGSADLTSLPSKMWHINLERNEFSGEINLAKLPPTMKYMSISHNKFSGELRLDKLPSGLEQLALGHNQFEGEIDAKFLEN